ncbi:MAG: putative AlkP superfamily phosphohydrolase/phosphomutase [Planctomycetota bacterium]|jgi:predicted AlkP superfamily phosphohydrolase/phosphomutase
MDTLSKSRPLGSLARPLHGRYAIPMFLKRSVHRLLPLGLLLAALAGLSSSASAQEGRVIVLGFDGADARTTQAMMEAGQLPNLSKLAEQGTFAPLHSTNPAESAAGWAALNTGQNPNENGVPSFILRTISDSGAISAAEGHVGRATKTPAELEPGGLLGILATNETTTLVAGAGVGLFLVFLILFAFLLRMNKMVAVLLAAMLGGVGAYGAVRAKGYVPREVSNIYTNKVRVPAMWDYAAESGKKSLVLDAALAFGRPTPEGARVLGGLGLPDIRSAGNGNWFIYTTSPLSMDKAPKGTSAGSSGTGTEFKVSERNGRIETEVYGPVNFYESGLLNDEWDALEDRKQNSPDLGWKEMGEIRARQGELEEELAEYGVFIGANPNYRGKAEHKHRTSLPMVIEREDDGIKLTIAGQTQHLKVGDWSDWYRLPFELNPLVKANAITRARLNSLDDDLVLYLSTFDIDPEAPPFWQPVSQPASFSGDLAKWSGSPYETLGWSCMTNQLKDKALDPTVFLEDIEFTMGWRRRLTLASMARDDWDLLFSVYSTSDRMQHIMYRFYDPLHPGHDAEMAKRTIELFGEEISYADAIPAIYKQIDKRVGEVLEKMNPEDTLILCADHGFTSYRRGMEVNNFLHAAGYLKLKDGVTRSDGKTPFNYVDWSRTQAYGVGLGMIYLNLEGREPNGIVPVEEARAVLEKIQADLLAAMDTGPEDAPYETPVHSVQDATIMWDKYPGDWKTTDYLCSDLMIGFAEFYRASWGTVVGKMSLKDVDGRVVAGPIYKNNTNRWSGDHASNSPDLVTGIFFSNRKVTIPEGGVSVLHIAPTVLDSLGVDVPADMELEPLELAK